MTKYIVEDPEENNLDYVWFVTDEQGKVLHSGNPETMQRFFEGTLKGDNNQCAYSATEERRAVSSALPAFRKFSV